MRTAAEEVSVRGCAGGDGAVLERNLAVLGGRSPRAAEAIRRAAAAELAWVGTDQAGAWSAEFEGRLLASRRRPVEEGERLAGTVDFREAGAAVVMGFGLGYHVASLARRAGNHSMVLVFEPDVGLLRAVLERADCSGWLRESRVFFFTDAEDGAELTSALTGLEALVGLGITIVEPAASRGRLGDSGRRFAETLTQAVAACRMQVITTMTQMEATFRNFFMNADHYAGLTGAGSISELKDAGRGLPAVLVSAGPSLERNLEVLGRPGVRERCVIVAVQTVLKTMLSRGIRPHFVTALDFHEISRRFYEGLSGCDVEGITLVAEPKVNAAVLGAYPGAVRLTGSETLDILLGEGLMGDHSAITPGATVAHLSYYFARHLGCDPVILVGQDLAFTDGQYYSAGAAIHEVWGPELNPFNTLETMEWQRIVRWRGHLHRIEDHLGRAVYTDDQMSTYLAQFERDFLADKEKGLTTIDATEGGARKAHTRSMRLDEALGEFARREAGRDFGAAGTGATDRAKPRSVAGARGRAFRARLRGVKDDAAAIARLSREAAGVLERMLEVHGDEGRVNGLIDRVHGLKERVQAKRAAYSLVHRLNQAGTYNRFRADRLLALDADLPPLERQKKQIERDIKNVRWLADAAETVVGLLAAALAAADGAAKLTSDPVAEARAPREGGGAGRRSERSDLRSERSDLRSEIADLRYETSELRYESSELRYKRSDLRSGSLGLESGGSECVGGVRVGAVVPVDFELSALGVRRAIDGGGGMEAVLRRTVERVAGIKGVDGVVLLTAEAERARGVVSGIGSAIPIDVVEAAAGALRGSMASVAAGRRWAATCWRGGLGGLTCYDEVFDPGLAAGAMERFEFGSALIVGADWCEVDAGLCEKVIARHRENPSALPLTFTQAPPGLCGCVVSLELTKKLAAGREAGDATATIGGLLGFKPTRPRRDPIAEACCVQIPAEIRSLHGRFVADCGRSGTGFDGPGPAHLILEVVAAGGEGRMSVEDAGRVLREFAAISSLGAPRPAGTGNTRAALRGEEGEPAAGMGGRAIELAALCFGILTIHGRGDPLLHPELGGIIRAAREAGIGGVHVRTEATAEESVVEGLLSAGPDVVSVDLHAATAERRRAITGHDDHSRALANTQRLLDGRRLFRGLPHPWVVPRITRCDAVYEEVESFYDRALYFTCAGVIDPLPMAREGERIGPLPKPRGVVARDAGTRMMVRCDGVVVADESDLGAAHHAAVGNVLREGVAAVWARLMARRRSAWESHGHTHPDLRTGY